MYDSLRMSSLLQRNVVCVTPGVRERLASLPSECLWNCAVDVGRVGELERFAADGNMLAAWTRRLSCSTTTKTVLTSSQSCSLALTQQTCPQRPARRFYRSTLTLSAQTAASCHTRPVAPPLHKFGFGHSDHRYPNHRHNPSSTRTLMSSTATLSQPTPPTVDEQAAKRRKMDSGSSKVGCVLFGLGR